MLGPERFFLEQARKELEPGVATGLAWTEAGGDVLYIEATLLPGARGLRLTGQLGDVMRESARAAQSYVWSHAPQLGIDPDDLPPAGVHIHVPAGAVPKDGPSAGVTMAAALTSLYTRLPVRSDTAMTGEITLTGLVLPVGGIKEKVLAARRAGIRRVILPGPTRRTSGNCRNPSAGDGIRPGGADRGRPQGGHPRAGRSPRRGDRSVEESDSSSREARP